MKNMTKGGQAINTVKKYIVVSGDCCYFNISTCGVMVVNYCIYFNGRITICKWI